MTTMMMMMTDRLR